MSFPKHGLGIIANRTSRIISIFDTECLNTLQNIPLDADIIDVTVNNECSRAVITSINSKTIFQLDLTGEYATMVGSTTASTQLQGVSMSPDGKFAVTVDGSGSLQAIASYSLDKNLFVSFLPTRAQAVAVSPNNNGLILTAIQSANSVHPYLLARDGRIKDIGQELYAGHFPSYIKFSRDGDFAFITNYYNDGVSVLSTARPDQIKLIGTVGTEPCQSIAVSEDGRHLFALGPAVVSIYLFDPVSGSLSLERSFAHGMRIVYYYGVDQIALDLSGERLFISAYGEVGVFTTFGIKLGTVAGASGRGGIKIFF